ncbi:hypothetical protein BC936DRAFT_142380 [Jimgerdemannia flammicorona]|uniref:Uncharacterized protein n=2 Tax=Jimgerdemannia flammicorona TaxID=994334 RepID=A0A433DF62_9FUNG|nr:hypothetical protein BC936DRAFT_142380 [Jimgerdemannia flammicorona]RUS27236.1 hypothetical protein BC938DRAFT_483552 [Jimgerdemannia flammicorona]
MIRNGLSKAAGVYGFQLISTGEIVYIGSSVNLARRFMDHVNNRGSNIPLQRGFAKHGVPASNFLSTAGSLQGYQHTVQTRAKMSAARIGNTKTVGKTNASARADPAGGRKCLANLLQCIH